MNWNGARGTKITYRSSEMVFSATLALILDGARSATVRGLYIWLIINRKLSSSLL